MPELKVFVGQINPTVGALESNCRKIEDAYRAGVEAGADIVMVPELAVTGYPPRDLLDKKMFIDANLEIRDRLAKLTGSTALLFGCVERNEKSWGKAVRNVAILAHEGKIVHRQVKSLLPTYDVFDELRYFEPAESTSIIEIFGRKIGISICEDYWFEDELNGRRLYGSNPVEPLARAGAEILLNISASPFNVGKRESRFNLFREIARRHSIPVVYVNQVGGNDELLFDGASIVIDDQGRTVWCGESFSEQLALVRLAGIPCDAVTPLSPIEEVGGALLLGLKDYARKCGFSKAVVGVSGGIDSAVVAALVAEALGAENLTTISMPSQFSSEGSVTDARALAEALAVEFHIVPIAAIYDSYRARFDELFGDKTFDVTDENVQARIRGNILMAFSNKTGALVVTTGNKSELAVGYCTLYGDMAGGLSLLGDVYKTTVYELARWINREREIVPLATITKPPSAELRPDQTDQDSLPPYDLLDAILKLYIEELRDVDEIIAAGFDRAVVENVAKLVDGAEFKRQQAAPTIRVSSKAFGSGRQMPIAERWKREKWKFIG
ncbi:MAG TPA: NAD+ synthase [Thermoanaerobaculia bacterium]|nr:NAD+ synthase [Thermoanaerobaculia bacterium]